MSAVERGKEGKEDADQLTGSRQLRRLERMMDLVFALAIWQMVVILPRPNPEDPEWETVWQMLTEQRMDFTGSLVGILILVVYWVQNNAHFSRLRATDPVHTALAIFQLFFVMFLLYAVALSMGVGSAYDTRALESVAAFLLGLFAYLGWRYAAAGRRLVSEELSDEEIRAISKWNLAEPLTALLTIPFAFVGPIAWELSWFLYPLLRWLSRRRVGP